MSSTSPVPTSSREAGNIGKSWGPRRFAVRDRGHASDILIPQIAIGPGGCAHGCRGQAREDIELARSAERRSGVEDEMKLAGLARGGSRDVEGDERGDVADSAVLEDLAGARVEVYGAGPDGVLGDGGGDYDVGAGGDGLGGGEGGGEAEDGGGDGGGEELHFDFCCWLTFKGKRLRMCLDRFVEDVDCDEGVDDELIDAILKSSQAGLYTRR